MREKKRWLVALVLFCAFSIWLSFAYGAGQKTTIPANGQTLGQTTADSQKAFVALEKLAVKGRAPKTNYKRTNFLNGWAEVDGCDVRNIILKRDLTEVLIDPIEGCKVIRGKLNDPYTGKIINLQRGEDTSGDVQIDHVVALSDAWQKGAQQLSEDTRNKFANDPLNLLAVDGPANQKKGDGDAATWLPPNKSYRCRYVARQIAVKIKYQLWITAAEKDAIIRQLQTCPQQVLPIEGIVK